MKSISAVELRNNLEGVVKSLKRGERLELTYRGEAIAEMIPANRASKLTPLQALKHAHAISAQDPKAGKHAADYLAELRAEQKGFGERLP